VSTYIVKTASGEHVVMLDEGQLSSKAVETTKPASVSTNASSKRGGSHDIVVSSQDDAIASALVESGVTAQSGDSPSNNNNKPIRIVSEPPNGWDLFLAYLPFIILILVLLIICALGYLFREKIPACVAGCETCCTWVVKILWWPIEMLWRCFKWCWYPIKECCIECYFNCHDIFYPARIKI